MQKQLDDIPEITVHREWSIARLSVISALVAGIFMSVIAVGSFQSLRSKAASDKLTPSPLAVVSLPPETQLESPYIRLVVSENTYSANEVVSVDVYADSGGKSTMEALIQLTYDGEVFDVKHEDIEKTDVYKSIFVRDIGDGNVIFSLFVNPQSGQPGVTLSPETKIATIHFRTKDTSKSEVKIDVEFDVDSASKTSLIPYSLSRDTSNILENVEGVTFSIEP